jgi:hypothetical protein
MYEKYQGSQVKNLDYVVVCGPIVMVEDEYVGNQGMYCIVKIRNGSDLKIINIDYYNNIDVTLNISYAMTLAKEVYYLKEGFLDDLILDIKKINYLDK